MRYLIIGSGLTGAVIARLLKDAGKDVLVVERRPHLGGNVHDHSHPSGIRVHTYGPHYFRTNSERIWKFVNRFSEFYKYEAVVKTWVDCEYHQWPLKRTWRKINPTPGTRINFEQECLSRVPLDVYQRFVKGYTEKQWGVDCRELSPQLASRIEIRENDDQRLTTHRHQGIPVNGYTEFMVRMLEGIPVQLNTDWLKDLEGTRRIRVDGVIFTGPIDEYFGFDLGRLKYRGQRRVEEHFPKNGHVLPCAQLNDSRPEVGHVRTLEWKRMGHPDFDGHQYGTVITTETPFTPTNPNDYEYPFPDETNQKLYQTYRARANGIKNLLICGRLGEYRYLDMDQAIGRAMTLAKRFL